MEEVLFELKVDNRNENCTIVYDDSIVNIDEKDIYEELNKIGVIVGINSETITSIVSGEFIDSKKMIIAKYIPPSKGKSQYLKYLIETQIDMKEDQSGHVDFYDIGLIKDIKVGHNIVEIIPPTKGTSGKNVLGEDIEGILGNEIEINPFVGEGTEIDSTNTFITATQDGVYKISHKKEVSVVDELVIKGDLNFSVGNIDTTSTVIVNGDLKAGFICRSTSPIIVKGVIEDAEIHTDESLVCKMGVLQGNTPIIVKNKIKAKYIRNRLHVESKNMYVQEMISGCNIRLHSELEAKKLIGGTTVVKEIVKLEELGSEQFIPTYIEVGVNPKIVKRLSELKNDIIKIRKEVQEKKNELEIHNRQFVKLSKKITELLTDKNYNKLLLDKFAIESKKNSNKINLCRTEIDNLNKSIKSKEKETQKFKKKIEKEDPVFEVSGKVYPNVTIKIKNSEPYTVKTILNNVIFLYDEEEEKVIIETNA